MRARSLRLDRVLCGTKAGNFLLLNDVGQERSLWSQQGKWHLIIFWTPDCDHCIKSFKEIEAHAGVLDLNLITVCNKESDEWKPKLVELQMAEWVNLINDKGQYDFPESYDITSTP